MQKADPYLTQTLQKKTKNLNEEYFQPIVRSDFTMTPFVAEIKFNNIASGKINASKAAYIPNEQIDRVVSIKMGISV